MFFLQIYNGSKISPLNKLCILINWSTYNLLGTISSPKIYSSWMCWSRCAIYYILTLLDSLIFKFSHFLALQPHQGPCHCPSCGQTYSLRKNMMRHLRLECGKEPKQQCPFCENCFKRRNNMVRHVRTCHAIEYNKLVTSASNNNITLWDS